MRPISDNPTATKSGSPGRLLDQMPWRNPTARLKEIRCHDAARRLARVVAVLAAAGVCSAWSGPAAGAPEGKRTLATVTVDTLPIANGLPLDLGISKGFFAKHGIEIKKVTLQSGNDIVLALANSQRRHRLHRLGAGVHRRHARGSTSRPPRRARSRGRTSPTTGRTSSSRARARSGRPQDLVGKTIAVNALKGVGEVVIRAALKKLGLDPKLGEAAWRSRSRRCARRSRTARSTRIHTPEPFMSQALNQDGARIVMAPGPAICPYLPNGAYVARGAWAQAEPHPREGTSGSRSTKSLVVRARRTRTRSGRCCRRRSRDIRLPVWSPVLDRKKLLQLAQLAKQFGVISRLPDLTKLVPGSIASGVILKGDVGASTISLRLDRQGGEDAGGGDGHGCRLRPLGEAELPPQGAGGQQEDRREGRGEDHLDGRLPEGHVPVLLATRTRSSRAPSPSAASTLRRRPGGGRHERPRPAIAPDPAARR